MLFDQQRYQAISLCQNQLSLPMIMFTLYKLCLVNHIVYIPVLKSMRPQGKQTGEKANVIIPAKVKG